MKKIIHGRLRERAFICIMTLSIISLWSQVSGRAGACFGPRGVRDSGPATDECWNGSPGVNNTDRKERNSKKLGKQDMTQRLWGITHYKKMGSKHDDTTIAAQKNLDFYG